MLTYVNTSHLLHSLLLTGCRAVVMWEEGKKPLLSYKGEDVLDIRFVSVIKADVVALPSVSFRW